MIFSTSSIVALISHYGYTIIFPISVVEGPIVTLISGFLVSLGLLNAFVAFCVLVLGDLVGDSIYYALGKWGGVSFVKCYGKYIGLQNARVKVLTEYFETRGWKLLLFSKTQAAGSIVLFSAGLANMPYGRFMKFNLLGTIPKVVILEAIGIYFGASFAVVSTYINGIAGVVTVITLLVVAYYLYRYYTKA